MHNKLNPQFLQEAGERLDSLRSISEDLDLGNGFTLMAYRKKIEEFQSILSDYNAQKSVLDGQKVQLINLETELRDMRELMLIAVALKYGKNSEEYAKAGGTRKVDRRKSRRSVIVKEREAL
jgi:hypothetical protein